MSRVYGANAVGELVDVAPSAIQRIVYTAGAASSNRALLDRARAAGVQVDEVGAADLQQRAGARGGAGIGADLRPPPVIELEAAAEPGPDGAPALVVALDQVTDPHNLGAVLRSAAAFGARAVVVPRDHSAPLNDAAVRASAGAVAHVPLVRVTNLARALRSLKDRGLWAIAADAEGGASLWSTDLTGGAVIVLGAEGKGIRPGVRKACDLSAALPMVGPVGSLNVSVTAGIFLAEASRQRAALRDDVG